LLRLALIFRREAIATGCATREMRARLQEFALSLHPEKTRLIEFGRLCSECAQTGPPISRRDIRIGTMTLNAQRAYPLRLGRSRVAAAERRPLAPKIFREAVTPSSRRVGTRGFRHGWNTGQQDAEALSHRRMSQILLDHDDALPQSRQLPSDLLAGLSTAQDDILEALEVLIRLPSQSWSAGSRGLLAARCCSCAVISAPRQN
jgi:hypothetical protein